MQLLQRNSTVRVLGEIYVFFIEVIYNLTIYNVLFIYNLAIEQFIGPPFPMHSPKGGAGRGPTSRFSFRLRY